MAGASSISASTRYSAVLLENGGLLTFGAGTHGLLGHGDAKDREAPTLVVFDGLGEDSVVQISTGSLYMGATTEAGSVFTWGYGGE